MSIKQTSVINDVKNIEFSKQKYGPELLIDVAWIHEMPTFEKSMQPYRLSFYDITLISHGTGDFWLDNEQHTILPNTLFFTSPGQVRRWFADDLDGLCLFFPSEFLLEHFNDALFLHRLRYFHTGSGPLSLTVTAEQQQYLKERFNAMRDEIHDLSDDSPHLLRAIAYEVLVKINRWYALQNGQKLDHVSHQTISRFRQLIEQHFKTTQSVAEYADLLNLTPGHLNFLCQKHLGTKASQLIHSRVTSEARRLLVHTDQDVGVISQHLGFKNSSYFSRSFKRATNQSPLHYRRIEKQRLM
jgi:AraC-like DNA-binding protein